MQLSTPGRSESIDRIYRIDKSRLPAWPQISDLALPFSNPQFENKSFRALQTLKAEQARPRGANHVDFPAPVESVTLHIFPGHILRFTDYTLVHLKLADLGSTVFKQFISGDADRNPGFRKVTCGHSYDAADSQAQKDHKPLLIQTAYN